MIEKCKICTIQIYLTCIIHKLSPFEKFQLTKVYHGLDAFSLHHL